MNIKENVNYTLDDLTIADLELIWNLCSHVRLGKENVHTDSAFKLLTTIHELFEYDLQGSVDVTYGIDSDGDIQIIVDSETQELEKKEFNFEQCA